MLSAERETWFVAAGASAIRAARETIAPRDAGSPLLRARARAPITFLEVWPNEEDDDAVLPGSGSLELEPPPAPEPLVHQVPSVMRRSTRRESIEETLDTIGAGPIRRHVVLAVDAGGLAKGELVTLDRLDGAEVAPRGAACSDPHLVSAKALDGRGVELRASGGCGLGRVVEDRPLLRSTAPERAIASTRARVGAARGPSEAAAPPGPAIEDAGSELGEVIMGGYRGASESGFVRDMVQVAAAEGFRVVVHATEGTQPGSLARVILDDAGLAADPAGAKALEVRTVRLPIDELHAFAKDAKTAKVDAQGRRVLLGVALLGPAALRTFERVVGDSPYVRTLGARQGKASEFTHEGQAIAAAAPPASPLAFEPARTYVEGGNLVVATGKDRRPYGLVGVDSAVISMLGLEERRAFDAPPLSTRLGKDALGTDGARALTELAPSLEAAGVARAGEKLATTCALIAEDLGLDRKRVVFVPQPGFHLDTYVLPLAPGTLLVHDYPASIALLTKLLEGATLEAGEARWIEAMRARAEQLSPELQPVMSAIAEEIGRADLGVTIVPTAGVFSSSRRGTRLPCARGGRLVVNFMNGFAARGLDGKTFLITNASSIGALEDAFAEHVRAHGVDRVYFTGAGAAGPNGRTFAEESLAIHGGGIACSEVHFAPVRAPAKKRGP